MMREPWTRGVLWLIAGIVCWCGACSAFRTREGLWNKDRVSFRNPVSTAVAENVERLRKEMKKESGGHVAGWGQQLSQSVSSPDTGGSSAVDILWVEGDASLVWDAQMAQGHLPKRGDAQGCALDKRTALKLFGTWDVLGRSVKLAGKTFEVRGVFDLPEGLSALGVDPGRGLVFAAAALAPSNVCLTALEFILYEGWANAKSQVTGWMQRSGISTSGDFDAHKDERGLFSFLMDVPAYALGVCILLELYAGALRMGKGYAKKRRQLRDNRLTPPRKWARLYGVYGAGFVCLLGLAGLSVALLPPIRSVPPSYLPTQWSDMAFWPDLIKQGLQNRAKVSLAASLRPDMAFGVYTGWMAGLLLAAVFCLWHGRSLMTRQSGVPRPLPAILCFVALCAGSPAAVGLMGWIGWEPSLKTALLMLPLILYACILFIRMEKLPGLLEVFFPLANNDQDVI